MAVQLSDVDGKFRKVIRVIFAIDIQLFVIQLDGSQ